MAENNALPELELLNAPVAFCKKNCRSLA